MTRDVRICVVGDSFANGYGDPKGQGWVGRVLGRTPSDELDLTVYNLAVRGLTSADVHGHWRDETSRRWDAGAEKRLVVAVGYNDVGQGLSLARTRLNLANIVDGAISDGVRPFVVGPPPALGHDVNERLRPVVAAQQDVCSRRGVPFVDCLGPLMGHDQWYADVASGDGTHPGQAGYGLLAWLVLHSGWGAWLGVSTD